MSNYLLYYFRRRMFVEKTFCIHIPLLFNLLNSETGKLGKFKLSLTEKSVMPWYYKIKQARLDLLLLFNIYKVIIYHESLFNSVLQKMYSTPQKDRNDNVWFYNNETCSL